MNREISPYIRAIPLGRFYIVLIIISICVLLLSTFAQTAFGKSNTDMTPSEQALSYTYLYSLSSCINDNRGALVTNNNLNLLTTRTKNINEGNWFNATIPPSKAASFLSSGADKNGLTQCNTIVKSASSLWGYKNPGELWCAFSGDSFCVNGSLGTTGNNFSTINPNTNNLIKSVTSKVYAGKTPSVNSNHMYLYYVAAFTNGCGAVESSNPTGDNAYKDIVFANSDGTVSTKSYSGSKRSDSKYVLRANTGAIKNTCAEIAGYVTQYARSYAEYAKTNQISTPTPPTGAGSTTDADTPQSSCIVDGIGYIVCPTIMALSSVADTSYAFLSNNFLEFNSSLLNTDTSKKSDDGTLLGTDALNAWRAMQALANIAFVIAFIFIIYSQLTSTGITNYGVKKLLPRIIVAAILVNTSFIVCQLAVDVSNVLGYGLKNVFQVIDINDTGSAAEAVSASTDGTQFEKLATGMLAGVALAGAAAVSIWLALPFLGGAVLAAVVALMSIGFLLIARKALIVLLVVIAPLAFVAYLLPNTEHLFTKWRKIFFALLMVFPVVGILFGAGTLASKILMAVAGTDPILQIVALVAAVIPLFAVWPVLRGSLDAVGGIGAKINNISRGAENGARAKGRQAWSNSRFGQAREFNKQRRAQTRSLAQSGVYTGESKLGKLYAGAHNMLNNSPVSGAAGSALATQGIVVANEQDEKAIKESMALLQSKGLTADQVQKIAMGEEVAGVDSNNENLRRAAIRKSMAEGGLAASEQLIASSGNMSPSLYKEVSKGVLDNKLGSQANYLGGDMADKIARGEIKSQEDLDIAAAKRISGGKFSAQSLASQDAKALERISKVMGGVENGQYSVVDKDTGAVVQSVDVNPQQHQALQDQAFEVRKEGGRLRDTITGEQAQHIDSINSTKR